MTRDMLIDQLNEFIADNPNNHAVLDFETSNICWDKAVNILNDKLAVLRSAQLAVDDAQGTVDLCKQRTSEDLKALRLAMEQEAQD